MAVMGLGAAHAVVLGPAACHAGGCTAARWRLPAPVLCGAMRARRAVRARGRLCCFTHIDQRVPRPAQRALAAAACRLQAEAKKLAAGRRRSSGGGDGGGGTSAAPAAHATGCLPACWDEVHAETRSLRSAGAAAKISPEVVSARVALLDRCLRALLAEGGALLACRQLAQFVGLPRGAVLLPGAVRAPPSGAADGEGPTSPTQPRQLSPLPPKPVSRTGSNAGAAAAQAAAPAAPPPPAGYGTSIRLRLDLPPPPRAGDGDTQLGEQQGWLCAGCKGQLPRPAAPAKSAGSGSYLGWGGAAKPGPPGARRCHYTGGRQALHRRVQHANPCRARAVWSAAASCPRVVTRGAARVSRAGGTLRAGGGAPAHRHPLPAAAAPAPFSTSHTHSSPWSGTV